MKSSWFFPPVIMFLWCLLLLSFSSLAVAAEQPSPKADVIYPVKYGISQPLRNMKAPQQPLKVTGQDVTRPIGYPELQEVRQVKQSEPLAQDLLLQQSAPVVTMPVTSMNFEGLNKIAGYYPPETCDDVGPNDYVQITNVYYQVFDKATGTPRLAAALPNNAMWTGFWWCV